MNKKRKPGVANPAIGLSRKCKVDFQAALFALFLPKLRDRVPLSRPTLDCTCSFYKRSAGRDEQEALTRGCNPAIGLSKENSIQPEIFKKLEFFRSEVLLLLTSLIRWPQ